DHGRFEHGHSLYGELTRVPLLVVGDGLQPQVVEGVVQHIDLYQGLLARARIASPAGTEGTDIFAVAAAGDAVGNRVALSENTLYGPPLVSLVEQKHRLVVEQARGFAEVWAVDEQGGETERLQGEEQARVAKRMLAALRRLRGDLAALEAVEGPEVPSKEVFQQLQALGYLETEDEEGPSSPEEEAAQEEPITSDQAQSSPTE
ncbi:MAG: hypothetical protein QGG40_20095, partial [Myxococcota bacterium]|nr:hypothetical protein [Myxococcota bacterium]